MNDPVLYFSGEKAPGTENAFLRVVTVTMNCSTPNAMLYYTTDGLSPGQDSSPVSPGTELLWSEEGTTDFEVVALADGLYDSEPTVWSVTVVAPRIDEHPLPEEEELDSGEWGSVW